MRMIEASAPGKLVVSGEYAVLAGAPALVAAVDRRVSCVLESACDSGWRFVGKGHAVNEQLSKAEVFRAAPDSVAGIVRRSIAAADAPDNVRVTVDSSPCYWHGAKLGVGSSAALVTAVAAACAALGGGSPRLAELYSLHAAFAGGGSGLDVAAAVTGGVIRFQERRVTPVRLPAAVAMAFVFTGASTRTRDMLARFDSWRGGTTPAALERLALAAGEVADCTGNADSFVEALGDYSHMLERFDRATRIGIFGSGHRRARELAAKRYVVYKPCGAGGFDTGMAVAADAAAVAAFAADAVRAGLTVVPMEIARNGIQVRTR